MRPKARVTACTVIIAGLAIPGAGAVQARPSLYTMTCSQAQAFVQSKGAVVADTGPNISARIVANGSFCDRLQNTKPLFGKTTDNPQCRIGFSCATTSMSSK